jgi:hypothetical protein
VAEKQMIGIIKKRRMHPQRVFPAFLLNSTWFGNPFLQKQKSQRFLFNQKSEMD